MMYLRTSLFLVVTSVFALAGEPALLDFNARYYNPDAGRFVSPDTMIPDPADPQMLNRYSYVNNRVIRFNDPTGHFPEEEGQEMPPEPTAIVVFIGGASDKYGEYGYPPSRIVGTTMLGYMRTDPGDTAFGYFAHDERADIKSFIEGHRYFYPNAPVMVVGHSLGGATTMIMNMGDVNVALDPHGSGVFTPNYNLPSNYSPGSNQTVIITATDPNGSRFDDPDWWVSSLGGNYDTEAINADNRFQNVTNFMVPEEHADVRGMLDNTTIGGNSAGFMIFQFMLSPPQAPTRVSMPRF